MNRGAGVLRVVLSICTLPGFLWGKKRDAATGLHMRGVFVKNNIKNHVGARTIESVM